MTRFLSFFLVNSKSWRGKSFLKFALEKQNRGNKEEISSHFINHKLSAMLFD
jgi:hypothetical protein